MDVPLESCRNSTVYYDGFVVSILVLMDVPLEYGDT